MLPSGRVVALCIFLFLASALISISARSTHSSASWPSLFHASPRPSTASSYSKVAFATFLAGDSRDNNTDSRDGYDGYYIGARVLAYQLLHDTATRTNHSIPFLVLVTSDVSQRKRARLAADGATVVLTDKLDADWVKPGADRWRDVLAKLRLFQMTAYKKICFIDADMLVTGPLDGVFDDPATDLMRTKQEPHNVKDDEATQPVTYMFAGKPDAWGYEHDIPPAPSDYLNSGFFVFTPSRQLFAYYVSLLKLPDRFNPTFPEQNLLNYAHRKEGNMPWNTLSWRWNMNWPTVRDLEGGAHSFHAKYWDDDPTHNPELKRIWQMQRVEMEGYYRGVEDALMHRY